jgi:hypothetical protein
MRLVSRFVAAWLAAATALGPAAGVRAEPTEEMAEMLGMLDHAAIVQEMVRACRDARPELAAALEGESQAWWSRNAALREAVDGLASDRDTPREREFRAYYEALLGSLARQLEGQRRAGHTEYASRCDGVLRDLAAGRLDYHRGGDGGAGRG